MLCWKNKTFKHTSRAWVDQLKSAPWPSHCTLGPWGSFLVTHKRSAGMFLPDLCSVVMWCMHCVIYLLCMTRTAVVSPEWAECNRVYTLYTAHFTLYILYSFTLYTTYYSVSNVHYTLHTAHYPQFTLNCKVYTVNYKLYTIHYTQ